MKLIMMGIESTQMCVEGYNLDDYKRMLANGTVNVDVMMVDVAHRDFRRRRAIIRLDRISFMYEIDEEELMR